jgi:hypothetical protein
MMALVQSMLLFPTTAINPIPMIPVSSPTLIPNLPATIAPSTNTPWTFSAKMVATNTQQTMIHAIPAQLLTMFQNRVYIPLSFFLIKSMERIRLEGDIKSFKSLTKPI